MNIVISQPRYLPAINYIQRLYFSDRFVLLDNVQRQARGFENRNKLLIPSAKWLTMPIESSSRSVIFDTKVSESNDWIFEHKKIISIFYRNHPNFSQELLDSWYEGLCGLVMFTDIVEKYLLNICQSIGFSPNLIRSTELVGTEVKKGVENIVDIVASLTGSDKKYISGSNGREYGIVNAFEGRNIEVVFHDWAPTSYEQFNQTTFTPFLPFLDYVFNRGMDSLVEQVKQPQVFKYE